jgi:calcineurin-like phosphoesterase family protein
VARPDFFISDTHFRHRKIIEFEAAHRPFATIEEHDAELVKRWNTRVGHKDIVLHCGDVFFGQGHEALAELNGIIWLVPGNHDEYPWPRYSRFARFHGAYAMGRALFTHVPSHPTFFGGDRRWQVNVHGHCHSRPPISPRHINISVEHTGLAPLPYAELKERIRNVV